MAARLTRHGGIGGRARSWRWANRWPRSRSTSILPKSPATTACSPLRNQRRVAHLAALNAGALKLAETDFKRFDQSPAAKRVLKLSELGLRADAAREWVQRGEGFQRYGFAGRRRSGCGARHLGPINQYRRAHQDAARLQPALPDAVSKDEIKKAATQAALDHALVFGLIRQESRFWAEAVSRPVRLD